MEFFLYFIAKTLDTDRKIDYTKFESRDEISLDEISLENKI